MMGFGIGRGRIDLQRWFVRLRKAPQWLAEMGRLAVWRFSGSDVDLATTSLDLAANPILRKLAGVRPLFFSRLCPMRPRRLIGWGNRWSGRRAVALGCCATEVCLVEDGFLRSVDRHDPPLSLAFDGAGIFYDADSESRLFRLIRRPLGRAEQERADRLIELWRQHGLSKYNHARDPVQMPVGRFVLVVDQVAGDLSLRGGQVDASVFPRMLEAALRENPGAQVVVKLHPDGLSDPRKRHFDPEILRQTARVAVLADDCHIAPLLARAARVYVATSQVGFEALIWGAPVRCFGRPFYAGWGVTEDEIGPFRGTADLRQLVHAALVDYVRYCHPETGAECTAELAMAHVGLQRAQRASLPPRLYAVGFSWRKRKILRRFVQGSEVIFVRNPARIPEAAAVLLWGSANPAGVPPRSRILRVEDGFLRSVGLGSAFASPLSWVVDDQGMHYDSSRASRLETILSTCTLSPEERERASALRDQIISARVTKYNLKGARWVRPAKATKVILVPGQVESDASLRFGSPDLSSNIDLLRRVRADEPAAHILYKPHPDVVAGLRQAGRGEEAALDHCDAILPDADVADLLAQVDEVHVLTSLLGFEALLRGVRVTCHGQPFYSGWGLTNDRLPLARRTRKLDLDMLVHGALIAHPRYISQVTHRYTTPERAVLELIARRSPVGVRGEATRVLLRLLGGR